MVYSIPAFGKRYVLQDESLHCYHSKHCIWFILTDFSFDLVFLSVLSIFCFTSKVKLFLAGERLSWCLNKKVHNLIPGSWILLHQTFSFITKISVNNIDKFQVLASPHWEVAATCALSSRLWSIWLWDPSHLPFWLHGLNSKNFTCCIVCW